MITLDHYTTLQTAYTYYNARLFGDELPECLITLQRRSRSYGYFLAEAFSERQAETVINMGPVDLVPVSDKPVCHTDEIALNPDGFLHRTDTEILSTLVHEMCHLWQEHCGTPPKNRYHNSEWAGKMKEVGLQPSATGEPGGKETGAKMTHYILYDDDAPFFVATREFLQDGMHLRWQSQPAEKAKREQKNKVKYSCPDCDLHVWGKLEINVTCGECGCQLVTE
jgi:predicted SprT family Zn-dependent metalloprotease